MTITGAPGAVVDLTVTSGSGVLSSAQVTLGSSGTAQVAVTPTGGGEITVGATSQGGALVRAVHPSGAKAPQSLAWVTPLPLSASVTLTAVAPVVVVPPVTVTSAPSVAAQVPARLQLAKSAPARVRRGRAITYTLTVTDVSARTARDVVVRDPLPAATVLGLLPKGARLCSGAVVWSIGALAPGQSVRCTAGAHDQRAPRQRRERGVGVGSNAATVRARARTRLIAPPRAAPAVVVPVTG